MLDQISCQHSEWPFTDVQRLVPCLLKNCLMVRTCQTWWVHGLSPACQAAPTQVRNWKKELEANTKRCAEWLAPTAKSVKGSLRIVGHCVVGQASLLGPGAGFLLTNRDGEQLEFESISKPICFVYTESFPQKWGRSRDISNEHMCLERV